MIMLLPSSKEKKCIILHCLYYAYDLWSCIRVLYVIFNNSSAESESEIHKNHRRWNWECITSWRKVSKTNILRSYLSSLKSNRVKEQSYGGQQYFSHISTICSAHFDIRTSGMSSAWNEQMWRKIVVELPPLAQCRIFQLKILRNMKKKNLSASGPHNVLSTRGPCDKLWPILWTIL